MNETTPNIELYFYRPGPIEAKPVGPALPAIGSAPYWGDRQEMIVRTFYRTEVVLQRIIAARGLTFWGEAVELILSLFAHRPEMIPDTPPLSTLPRGLGEHVVRNRYLEGRMPAAKPILCRLSPPSRAFVERMRKDWQCSPTTAASAFLYCHADYSERLLSGAEGGGEA